MAPDRGLPRPSRSSLDDTSPPSPACPTSPVSPAIWDGAAEDQTTRFLLIEDQDSPSGSDRPLLCPRADDIPVRGSSFTVRGVLAGLLVGLVICFSNMYFGLQTGWVSSMTMPASLMGFGTFKTLSRHLKLPFSPVENVLVQTVAGSMAIMPLGCGFVGVIPAMNYLLSPEEQGPLSLSLGKLTLWALGLCYFGVVFAVPLRHQVIIREQLKFPSGFSTAVLISVLHGQANPRQPISGRERIHPPEEARPMHQAGQASVPSTQVGDQSAALRESWKANVRLLLLCFSISGVFTVSTYFLPTLRNIPIFGTAAAELWLWTLNPSLAYVGQGIIMGPATTLHMLLGAVVGWGVLSPLAKHRGWAPGPIRDWETGSQGWIVWVSLAIMLADAIVSLANIASRAVAQHIPQAISPLRHWRRQKGWWSKINLDFLPLRGRRRGYASVSDADEDAEHDGSEPVSPSPAFALDVGADENDSKSTSEEDDAPPDQLVDNRTVVVGLVLSILFCILCIHLVFGDLVPLYATIVAVLMALILSIMGVRALGETDLNPVSGISKLAQLFFAVIIPQSNKSSVLINLVAGAVSEAGALQAGDLMQDLKTGHLVGAAPKAQFWGQVIGATVGAVVSAFIYQLYTAVYEVPGDLFQVPTGYVWIFTARLVTGKGLPPMAEAWAIGSAVLFAVFTLIRIVYASRSWHPFIPGGIAVAVGMYNVPSFTLARTIGGLFGWYWRTRLRGDETRLIVLASGFILGEGFLSIVNLAMQSLQVPHL